MNEKFKWTLGVGSLTARIKIYGKTLKWAEQSILLIEKAKGPQILSAKEIERDYWITSQIFKCSPSLFKAIKHFLPNNAQSELISH